MPTFSIRPYHAEDAAGVCALFYRSVREVASRSYTPAQIEAWVPSPPEPEAVHARALDGRFSLVAVDADGRLVGWGDMERDGHIDHLFCHPDALGQGVGGAILDGLTALAPPGTPRLFVEASEVARPLFERRGFGLIRRRDFELRGVMIHHYLMEKRLA